MTNSLTTSSDIIPPFMVSADLIPRLGSTIAPDVYQDDEVFLLLPRAGQARYNVSHGPNIYLSPDLCRDIAHGAGQIFGNLIEQSRNPSENLTSIFALLEPNRSSETIPASIQHVWGKLRTSQLNSDTFAEIVNAARDRSEQLSSSGYEPINEASLDGFLTFWESVRTADPKFTEPEIFFSPHGLTHAEWEKNSRNLLVLEFQVDGRIFFHLNRDGCPIDGIQPAKHAPKLAKMLREGGVNPFIWE